MSACLSSFPPIRVFSRFIVATTTSMSIPSTGGRSLHGLLWHTLTDGRRARGQAGAQGRQMCEGGKDERGREESYLLAKRARSCAHPLRPSSLSPSSKHYTPRQVQPPPHPVAQALLARRLLASDRHVALALRLSEAAGRPLT